MMRRTMGALLTVLMLLAALPAFGSCVECRYSPNGWGNCRLADGDGYIRCERVVVDSFSGQTDCSLSGTCLASGGGGRDDCWWTDLDGNCIYSY